MILLVGGSKFVHNIDALFNVVSILPSLAADLIVGIVVSIALIVTLHLFKLTMIYKS